MVADADPPTKKRRTGKVPTTPDGIAQSNATLQYLTGSRHNRWMYGFGRKSPNDTQTASASSRPAKKPSTNGTPSSNTTPAVSSPRLNHATASASNTAPSTASASNTAPSTATASNNAPSTATASNTAPSTATASNTAPSTATASNTAPSTATASNNAPSTANASNTAPSTATVSNNAPSTPAVPPDHTQMQQPRPTSRTAQRPPPPPPPPQQPSLVQYEVPLSLPTPNTSASGRKSMDATAMPRSSAQPGLPSPAPSANSDENNTGSPTLAENHLQQRRSRASLAHAGHARPNTESWLAPATRASVSASRAVMSPTPQSLAPQHHLPPQSYLQPAVSAMHGHAHANPPPLHRSSINSAQLPPDLAQIMQHGQPMPTSMVLPSNVQPQPLQASRIPVKLLLQRLSDIENNPTHTLSQTETGRLILLREAVEKQDWFYQMTSQLFCMHSVNPGGLPQSVLNLDPGCWDYLSALLCHNTDISPALLRFFENFPEPLMHIYSDQSHARDIYERRLVSVRSFLHRMPTQWEGLVARCKDLQVPPLVQDLAEKLHVNGEVLQTTVFRAIMRMLYGPNEIALMNVVEKLHHLDQDGWNKHLYKRTPLEKSNAYTKLHSVWKRWSAWKSQGRDAADFVLPGDVLEFFSKTPPNPFLPSAAQAMNIQQAQNTNQHQHLVNRYAQAQAHARPGRLTSVSAQGVTPPTQQQHLQYQAGLMALAAGRSPVNAQGFSAPGIPYGRSRNLYPSSQDGQRAQPTQPDPARSALHQAHLRSPELISAKVDSETSRLFRHVVGFSLPPTQLDRSSPLQTVTFEITAPVAEQLAKIAASPMKTVDEQSLTLRLRCSALPAAGFASESAWVITDNYWPEEVCFECNGVKLDTRRKLHHGRYLPIDLTDLVTSGENTLSMTASCKKPDQRDCAIAVEVVGFTSLDSISRRLPFITAEQSLTTIKRSLSGQDEGDDDLAVTSSTMTIKLIDPYSGCRIFDTPVRGATCLHKDCFDLETFLSMCKRPTPDAPTVVDCWRCPLCRGDVRPQTLLVDGFMVRVREELADSNALDTRAIIVEADGSWRPKKDEASGIRSPSLERDSSNSMPPPPSIPKAAAKPPPIVIELD